MHTARLGLIVGKRVLRRAVDRNRARRVVREVFRCNRLELPEVDIVVQLVSVANAAAIRETLLIVFGELRNRCQ